MGVVKARSPNPSFSSLVMDEIDRLRLSVEGVDGTGGIKKEIGELRDTLNKLDKKVTLMFGLGVGAMASSGLISEGASHLIKMIAGLG